MKPIYSLIVQYDKILYDTDTRVDHYIDYTQQIYTMAIRRTCCSVHANMCDNVLISIISSGLS